MIWRADEVTRLTTSPRHMTHPSWSLRINVMFGTQALERLDFTLSTHTLATPNIPYMKPPQSHWSSPCIKYITQLSHRHRLVASSLSPTTYFHSLLDIIYGVDKNTNLHLLEYIHLRYNSKCKWQVSNVDTYLSRFGVYLILTQRLANDWFNIVLTLKSIF